MNSYLLDTGILLGIVRGSKWATKTRADLESVNSNLFTSAICIGELLALSIKNKWGAEKQSTLRKIINRLPSADINRDNIFRTYAAIDAWTHGNQLPYAYGSTPLPPKPARPMQQNDLWIAATACVTGATLVSTDKDFKHLKDIWIQYIYISQDL